MFMQPETIISRAWRVDTKPEGVLPFFASTPFDASGAEEETLIAYFADLLGMEESDIYNVERDDYPCVYARLSAPGYMDRTDWSGPFATEKEALEYLAETYGDDGETEA